MNSPDPQQEYANALHRIAELEQQLILRDSDVELLHAVKQDLLRQVARQKMTFDDEVSLLLEEIVRLKDKIVELDRRLENWLELDDINGVIR